MLLQFCALSLVMPGRSPASRPSYGAGMEIVLGVRCIAGGKEGVARYVGETQFSQGQWVGIELDAPLGKNDGTVAGVKYFMAAPNHGLFVKRSLARLAPARTALGKGLLATTAERAADDDGRRGARRAARGIIAPLRPIRALRPLRALLVGIRGVVVVVNGG